MKSSATINVMNEQFARHGIPDTVISDNGPQYANHEFKRFAKNCGFEHNTSSSQYPQSNGLAERTVQTVKKLFKKAKLDGRDPYLALLDLWNAPVGNFGTPTQLLMGRRTKTTLPIKPSLLNPGLNHKGVREELGQRQTDQKKYYDRSTELLPELKEGERVRIAEGKEWRSGTIVKKCAEPRSYVVENNNKLYRRNRRDILKTAESQSETPEIGIESTPQQEVIIATETRTPDTAQLNCISQSPSLTGQVIASDCIGHKPFGYSIQRFLHPSSEIRWQCI